MDRKIIVERLRNADLLIAEQQTELERFKVEMAGLEPNGRSTSDLRHAVERLEAALALNIKHREELAKSLPGGHPSG
jgi:ubiquinone biosynthesis protein UbiJ